MIRSAFWSRLVFVLLVTCYVLLVNVSPASAQSYTAPNTEPNVPKNLSTLTQGVFIEVINALNCQLSGYSPSSSNQKCLGVNPKTGQIGFVENGGGMIGITTKMIAVLYTPPAHFSEYTQYLASNFGIVKPAFAAGPGFGFQSISPFMNIWKAFRNIVYMLFLIVFVVIGMAIMLRIHIDARTVMSIENQIPKIIIGILMVTFSFPIVGMFIDVMWLGTYVTINVLASVDPEITRGNAENPTISSQLYTSPIGFANEALKARAPNGDRNVNGIMGAVFDGAGSVKDIFQKLFTPETMRNSFLVNPTNTSNEAQCRWNPGCIFKQSASNAIGDIISAVFAWLIGYIIGILMILVFTIAILVALFRLWISLLQAYIYLLLDIVLAPFWILASLFPGSPLTIGTWIRDIMANLSAFMVSITFILLGKVFMNALATQPATAPFPVPLIGNPGEPNTLSALLGIGIILLTPTVVQMMRDVFKAPKFEYTKAIGQSLSAGTGFAGNVGSGIGTRWFKKDYKGSGIGLISSRLNPGATGRGAWAKNLGAWVLGTHK